MNCPRCGQDWCCPCKSCRERGKEGDVPWIREGKENEKCPKCGLSKSLDWWGELECQIYLEKPKVVKDVGMSKTKIIMEEKIMSSALIEVKCHRTVFKNQPGSDTDECVAPIYVSSFINPAFVMAVNLGYDKVGDKYHLYNEFAVIQLRDGTTYQVTNEEAHRFLQRMDYLRGDK